jgi:hypothetical protein
VTDPTTAGFETVGEDFEKLMQGVLRPVTVESVNPDTGTALVTATNVPALKRTRRRNPFTAQGGELAADTQRFVFRASRIAAVMKAKDRITEQDGTVWVVDERGAELIARDQLWTVNVSKKRG